MTLLTLVRRGALGSMQRLELWTFLYHLDGGVETRKVMILTACNHKALETLNGRQSFVWLSVLASILSKLNI